MEQLNQIKLGELPKYQEEIIRLPTKKTFKRPAFLEERLALGQYRVSYVGVTVLLLQWNLGKVLFASKAFNPQASAVRGTIVCTYENQSNSHKCTLRFSISDFPPPTIFMKDSSFSPISDLLANETGVLIGPKIALHCYGWWGCLNCIINTPFNSLEIASNRLVLSFY